MVTWDQALLSFRSVNNIPAEGETKREPQHYHIIKRENISICLRLSQSSVLKRVYVCYHLPARKQIIVYAFHIAI